MSEKTADTPQGDQGDPSAGDQELSVPKYRLDQVSARVKQLEEEVGMKDQLLQGLAQKQPQEQPNQLSAESLGMDPEAFQAAKKIAAEEISKVSEGYKNQIGHLANQMEEQKFLIKHGKDADSYLDSIRQFRQKHHQTTGGFIDVETAYKAVWFDEREAKRVKSPPQKEETTQTTESKPAPQVTPESGGPPAAGTQTSSAPTNAPAESKEESLEEMEARLDGQLAGNPV